MTSVKQTSIETYQEIQDEGIREKREDLVLNYIKSNPGKTGREIAYDLGYSDMNEVRPRITDLFNKGLILYGNKRLSEGSNRPSGEVWLVSDFEKSYLNKLGFKRKDERLYYFETPDFILFQDFRDKKRKSYAIDSQGNKIEHTDLWIHKLFKTLMEVNKI